jgi:hypothetical protein
MLDDPHVSIKPVVSAEIRGLRPFEEIMFDERMGFAFCDAGVPQAHDVAVGDDPAAVVWADDLLAECNLYAEFFMQFTVQRSFGAFA